MRVTLIVFINVKIKFHIKRGDNGVLRVFLKRDYKFEYEGGIWALIQCLIIFIVGASPRQS